MFLHLCQMSCCSLNTRRSLAAPALDAHHVDERVTADGPLGARLGEAAGRRHEPGLAPSQERACHISQCRTVPANKHGPPVLHHNQADLIAMSEIPLPLEAEHLPPQATISLGLQPFEGGPSSCGSNTS